MCIRFRRFFFLLYLSTTCVFNGFFFRAVVVALFGLFIYTHPIIDHTLHTLPNNLFIYIMRLVI